MSYTELAIYQEHMLQNKVRPIIEYASSVWDPHTAINIQKLESIQKRAAIDCALITFLNIAVSSAYNYHLVFLHYGLEERKLN